MAGLSCLNDPAAALRGLAKVFSPRFWLSRLSFSKPAFGISTSPRTSSSAISVQLGKDKGRLRMVRTLCVMSSPTCPSPRVTACTNCPYSYLSDTARPSSLSSISYSGTVLPSRSLARRKKPAKSSASNTLPNDSIGMSCATCVKNGNGSPPTVCIGLSAWISEGWAVSSAISCRLKPSYSPSLMVGLSST